MFLEDYIDEALDDWLTEVQTSNKIKDQLQSTLAVTKLANELDETQAAVRRYCDVPAGLTHFACIVSFEPDIKRYRMEAPWSKENLLDWLGRWISRTLNEYLRIEKISEEKTGHVHVFFDYKNLNTMTLNSLMHAGTKTEKVILMYSTRVEESMLARDVFINLADMMRKEHCYFGMIDLALNEMKEMSDVDLPSMVMLKGYADITAANFQGAWTLPAMAEFVKLRL